MHPVHTLPLYIPKIHSHIILSSRLRSSMWPLPFRFSNQNFLCIHIAPMHATCSVHLIVLCLITLIITLSFTCLFRWQTFTQSYRNVSVNVITINILKSLPHDAICVGLHSISLAMFSLCFCSTINLRYSVLLSKFFSRLLFNGMHFYILGYRHIFFLSICLVPSGNSKNI